MIQLILLALLVGAAVMVMLLPPSARRERPDLRSAPPLPRGYLVRGLLVVLGLAAVAWTVYLLPTGGTGDGAEEVPLLAVVPLASVGSQEPYIAHGLTEELTTRLGRLQGLRVASGALARELGTTLEGREGRAGELGVDYLLEGSISLEGSDADRRIRVRVRLVDVRESAQVWGEVYSESVDRIFEVEGRIARRVVSAMDVALLEGEMADLIDPRTTNYPAYDRFLEGLALRRNVRTPSRALRALEAFRESAALDPDFAAAWAGQASVHIWLAWYHGFSGQLDSAAVELDRGEALDPEDEDVRLARAIWTWAIDGDLDSAISQYRALSAGVMAQRRPLILHYLAHLEARRGDLAEALQLARAALAIDPFYSSFNTNLSLLLLHDGGFREARSILQRAAASGTDDPRVLRWLVLAPVLQDGDTAEARGLLSELDADSRAAVLGDGLHWEARALVRVLGPHLPSLPPRSRGSWESFQAGSLLSAAVYAAARGDDPGARARFGEAAGSLTALMAREEALAPEYRARVRAGLAVARAGLGQHEAARRLLEESEASLSGGRDNFIRLDLLVARAEALLMSGDVDGATAVQRQIDDITSFVSPALRSVDPLWSAAARGTADASRPRGGGRP